MPTLIFMMGMRAQLAKRKLQNAHLPAAEGRSTWAELFASYDTDGSGKLNLAEMYMCVRQGAGMSEKTISNCARGVLSVRRGGARALGSCP